MTLKSMRSRRSGVGKDSDTSSLSDESRSLQIINHAKEAAQLAAKNRELNKKMSKKRADEYYKKQEEDKQQLKKKQKKMIGSSKSRERSEESKKQEESGNWFTNLFMFCGTSSCCTSKATNKEKDNFD